MVVFYEITLYHYSSLKYLELLSCFDSFTEKIIGVLDLTEQS